MRRVARLILNQKETNKGLFVNDANIKNIIGYQPENNINVSNVNLELLCEVAPYYTALSYLITWYFGMMMLTSTKKSFSALEIQRQLGHPLL